MGGLPCIKPDMNITELLDLDRIACDFQATSKKRVLEELSTLIADSTADLTQAEIFDSLIGREKLGSTGLGHGVAIPHGRMKGRDRAIAAFIKLDQGVDFDASDNRPVDLLFALLVPEHFTNEHLDLLAQLAEMFDNEEFCNKLRSSHDTGQIMEVMRHWQPKPRSASA